ncbi:1534_t:CDS:2 [Entrophospora sp. SA101]|nr:1534_t:CDS:2 [Entrophospora sp. SA101]
MNRSYPICLIKFVCVTDKNLYYRNHLFLFSSNLGSENTNGKP